MTHRSPLLPVAHNLVTLTTFSEAVIIPDLVAFCLVDFSLLALNASNAAIPGKLIEKY